MSIAVRAYANADDALIAWRPKPWPDERLGSPCGSATSNRAPSPNQQQDPSEGRRGVGPGRRDLLTPIADPPLHMVRPQAISLAQIYAVHVQIVYDHFSWRAFLAEGGDPCTLYASLSGWETGSKARDLG